MGLKTFKIISCDLLALFIFSFPVFAEETSIAILTPSASQELSITFESIIDGIKQTTPKFEKEIRILTDDNQDEIKKWLLDTEFLVVVTIGNKTTSLVDSLSITAPIITTGTFLSINKGYGGVSLSLSGKVIKDTLQLYLPHIKKLHIGDEGDNLIWFSNDHDAPKIIRQKIDSEQKSIVQYLWKTINQADPKTEAVWINNNIEHLYLYKLSERAWERNVTLISNNISHLESGTLLAIYPDFKGLGKRTGNLVTSLINQPKQNSRRFLQLEPLRAVYQGINLKTAQHLGVQITPATEHEFRVLIK